jgi:C-terminal processing protease CtpA/Prc
MNKISSLSLIIACAALIFGTLSCEKDTSTSTPTLTKTQVDSIKNMHIRGEIYSFMTEAYLWYDKIPRTTDTLKNAKPEDFFYKMLYTSLDKWSFIVNVSDFENLMKGVYYGHGISISLDQFGNFRVGFVYNSTRAYKEGIDRGWIIKRVNGKTPLNFDHLDELLGSDSTSVTNQFEFLAPDGTTKYISLTKEMVNTNSILTYKVIEFGAKKVGYIAVESFFGDNIDDEFNTVFSIFKSSQINELVIDLRYNGGGSLDASLNMASLICGNSYLGSTFCRLQYNNQINSYISDTSKVFNIAKKVQSLNNKLSRVFFLTSQQTASASENLIKGLQPFLNTYLIGTRTDGKPVGMNPIQLTTGNYVLVPIMFEWKNQLLESAPYTGIPVDFEEFDDLSHQFGDTSELCLKQAIHFIKNGKFDSRTKNSTAYNSNYEKHWRGIRSEVGAY